MIATKSLFLILREETRPLYIKNYSYLINKGFTSERIYNEYTYFIFDFIKSVEVKNVDILAYYRGFIKIKFINLCKELKTNEGIIQQNSLSLSSKTNDNFDLYLEDTIASEENIAEDVNNREMLMNYVYGDNYFLNNVEKRILALLLTGAKFIDVSKAIGLPYVQMLTIYRRSIKKIQEREVILEINRKKK